MSFNNALQFVLRWEGGYSNNPNDLGGPTNFGITYRTYEQWLRSTGRQLKPIKHITMDEVAAIYKQNYWDASHCEEMPIQLAIAVFDFAVNAGVTQALRSLQRCIKTAPDGEWGPNTKAALAQALEESDETQILNDYMLARTSFYAHIVARNPSQQVFLKGWMNRINALEEKLGL